MRTALLLCACAAMAACDPIGTTPDAGPPWVPPPPPRPDAGPMPVPSTVVDLPDVPALEQRPALTGGSLAITETGLVVAGDPGHASIWVLDTESRTLRGRITLEPNAEPGRMAVDSDGRVHVVLRGTGALLTLDPETATVIEVRAVCRTPRGVAWDGAVGLLWVACADGQLLTIPPSRSPATPAFELDDDLRDVLVGEDRLFVSRFRTAELLEVDPATGELLGRRRPPTLTRLVRMRREPTEATVRPNTAWRIQLAPSGDVVMLHQTAISTPIEVEMSGYSGDDCGGGVVGPALSLFSADGTVRGGGNVSNAVLAVDLAISPTRLQYYVAAAATDGMELSFGMGALSVSTSQIEDDCLFAEPLSRSRRPTSVSAIGELPDGRVVTLHEAPFRVVVVDAFEFASPARPLDRGFELFHTATPSMTACASCHPEGGEDGHVWDFVGTGLRRTQTLQGGLLDTAPFHWSGDQADMSAIMTGGFMQRMGGSSSPDDADLVAAYLDGLPLPARPDLDVDAVARGAALFSDASTSCAGCHSGDALTDNRTIDVGTGGAFQVPSLRGVAFRAPYFHDGCAESLDALVAGVCASDHTNTEHLDEAQRADLVAYLRSL